MKGVVLIFCLLSAFLGVADMLTPDGQTAKMVKFFCALTFLFVLLSAVPKIDLSPIAVQSSADIQTENIYTAAAQPIIAALLKDSGIEYKKITVCTDKTDTDGISINEITVFIEQGDAQKIKELLLKTTTASSVEVVYE